LIGLNRAIVKQGLEIFKKRLNLGLKTLYDLSNIEHKPTIYDLGFKLGPRINAGGRVGKSSHGAELLTSSDPQRAYKIAVDLDRFNKERQSIEMMLLEKVNLEAQNFLKDNVLVLSGDSWHEGIIGIVASRIKEKYNKPTILISTTGEIGKGSARSVFGFNIGSMIIKATQLGILHKGGGHKMAGGFTVDVNKINLFRKFLLQNFEKLKLKSSKVVDLFLDTIIAPSAVNEKFYEEIEFLAPFGSGNNEPKFAIENLKVIKSNIIGNHHIKSILSGKDGSVIKSIAFNAKDSPLEGFLDKKNKKKINIAGKMNLNEWKGNKSVQFIIEDISL
jgi:single-stranded-DNA-specific exonuclease